MSLGILGIFKKKKNYFGVIKNIVHKLLTKKKKRKKTTYFHKIKKENSTIMSNFISNSFLFRTMLSIAIKSLGIPISLKIFQVQLTIIKLSVNLSEQLICKVIVN